MVRKKAQGKKEKKGEKEEQRRKGGRKRAEGTGLVSSAGLMRYYDVEESAIKVSPMTIILIGILFGILVISLEILYYGVWPPRPLP
ncbi:MAG: preprotein translocase subunit Sec61beta [Candidatus Methanospirare jalkutatii]|nr:preprotein translocase subunit Sec61beta [Candidatus Methanospirare jalkutatii]